jgi:hypothetical protein
MSEIIKKDYDALKRLLNWAIHEMSDESPRRTPKHDCEYSTDPESGKCDFCENYWDAVQLACPEIVDEMREEMNNT